MQLKACLKQLNRAHAWSYHHAINLIVCSFCFETRRNSKISLVLQVEDWFLRFFTEKSSQVKFDMQPNRVVLGKKIPYNIGVIKIKQNDTSKLGSWEIEHLQW